MAKEQVSSILRALQILECFMDRETEWTLKALVDHLDMPSTTVFRQVSTLAERQYLVQDPVRKSYRVGPRLMLLASAILGQSDLRRVARPELEHLSDTVHETINLSVLLEHDIFYLDKVETHRSIVCNTQIGGRAPAYATSSGKAMLSCQNEAYKIELIKKQAKISPKDRVVVPAPVNLTKETDAPPAALELPDGKIVLGKTKELLGASAAVLLNAVKELGGIDHSIDLISPESIAPIQELKVRYLGSGNPRLHTDEVLIALSTCAATDENARIALEQLPKLRGCQVHTTVMLSNVDKNVFKKLGIGLTCEPVQEDKKIG